MYQVKWINIFRDLNTTDFKVIYKNQYGLMLILKYNGFDMESTISS